MSQDRPNIQLNATPKLVELLERLGADSNFQELMVYLESRCTGLAVWAHSIPDTTLRLWAGGRVQELADLLRVYHDRHQLLRYQRETPPGVPSGV